MEKSFGLQATPFYIAYVDDDSETISITNETDLTEAINYFKPTPNEDPPLSSTASILSGRSFRNSKITLPVNIIVDYEGISLSDTGSLVSLEEYKNRNSSGYSLSYTSEAPRELEDDAITVSSKDVGSKYDARAKGAKTIVAGHSREPLIEPPNQWETGTISSHPRTTSSNRSINPLSSDDTLARYSDDPSSVFARLKLEEERLGLSPGNLNGATTFQTERGVNWLRDQSSHLPVLDGDKLSVSDFSLEDSMSLELERNQHGNYRYTLTGSSGSVASQSVRDYGSYDDGASAGVNEAAVEPSVADSAEKFFASRPTSLQASIPQRAPQLPPLQLHQIPSLQLQQLHLHPHRSSTVSSNSVQNPFMSPDEMSYPADYIHPDIPPEVLSFIRPAQPLAPPIDPTNCSNCGVLLDMIKYVCSTCGEVRPPFSEPSPTVATAGDWPDHKGKTRAIDIHGTHREHSYPPLRNSPSASASSLTIIGSSASQHSGSSGSSDHHTSRAMSESTLYQASQPRGSGMSLKPLPIIPNLLSPRSSMGNGVNPPGYELCSMCVQSYGVEHSLEFSATPGASPGPGTSPEDAERALSRWRRTAPSQKGLLRHAYIERSWTHNGWEDVGKFIGCCGAGCVC